MNDQENIPWTQIRHGNFAIGTNEYRIPCTDFFDASALIRMMGGGRQSWNETIGDYVGVDKTHPLWRDICKMKS